MLRGRIARCVVVRRSPRPLLAPLPTLPAVRAGGRPGRSRGGHVPPDGARALLRHSQPRSDAARARRDPQRADHRPSRDPGHRRGRRPERHRRLAARRQASSRCSPPAGAAARQLEPQLRPRPGRAEHGDHRHRRRRARVGVQRDRARPTSWSTSPAGSPAGSTRSARRGSSTPGSPARSRSSRARSATCRSPGWRASRRRRPPSPSTSRSPARAPAGFVTVYPSGDADAGDVERQLRSGSHGPQPRARRPRLGRAHLAGQQQRGHPCHRRRHRLVLRGLQPGVAQPAGRHPGRGLRGPARSGRQAQHRHRVPCGGARQQRHRRGPERHRHQPDDDRLPHRLPEGEPDPQRLEPQLRPGPDRRQPGHRRASGPTAPSRSPTRPAPPTSSSTSPGGSRAPRSPSRCSTAKCDRPRRPRAPPGFQVPPGTWAVGPVPPGRYVAPGGAGCSWQRIGSAGEVLGTRAVAEAPRTLVDILATDAVFTSVGLRDVVGRRAADRSRRRRRGRRLGDQRGPRARRLPVERRRPRAGGSS